MEAPGCCPDSTATLGKGMKKGNSRQFVTTAGNLKKPSPRLLPHLTGF
jgi:hypothetical protein